MRNQKDLSINLVICSNVKHTNVSYGSEAPLQPIYHVKTDHLTDITVGRCGETKNMVSITGGTVSLISPQIFK